MHSLANLVVWTKLYFLLPENKENKISKFFVLFLSKITFQPVPQEAENAGNMPNGLRREKFGQGLPPVQVIFKKMAKNGRDRTWKTKKCAQKVSFLDKYLC